MKKILTVLLAAAMIMAVPTSIFADETNNELNSNAQLTDINGSINLVASKISSYTVKFPKSLDVTDASKTCDFYVKGDVDGSKKVVIDKGTGTHQLTDKAGTKAAVALSISFGSGVEGKDILSEYGTAKETMTITHGALAAATYGYELPVVIKLVNIQQAS